MKLNHKLTTSLLKTHHCCSNKTAFYSSIINGFKDKPDVSEVKKDVIGPPDKESNIRPILRYQSPNETLLQQQLRLRQLDVEKWNQEFWKNHNERFYNEKEDFMKAWKSNPEDTMTADEMSIFYKKFLDSNWRLHCLYNVSWYTKNVELLVLAARVNIQSLVRKLRRKEN